MRNSSAIESHKTVFQKCSDAVSSCMEVIQHLRKRGSFEKRRVRNVTVCITCFSAIVPR